MKVPFVDTLQFIDSLDLEGKEKYYWMQILRKKTSKINNPSYLWKEMWSHGSSLDCFTNIGGNQYINFSETGRYED